VAAGFAPAVFGAEADGDGASLVAAAGRTVARAWAAFAVGAGVADRPPARWTAVAVTVTATTARLPQRTARPRFGGEAGEAGGGADEPASGLGTAEYDTDRSYRKGREPDGSAA
jgi:hypothetical protein